MRLSVNRALPLAALILLGGCTSFGGGGHQPAPLPATTGPAADYPITIGDPFTIGGITYTPVDQLNYDAVGYARAGEGSGVTGAHKTLPLPSYVEVTSLDSGKTIFVRLDRRGPMVNDLLVELSPDAAAQLGLMPGAPAPVRVRRVNPPEVERAELRQGREAPARMDTPQPLLKVLKRKLAEQSPLGAPASTPPAMPQAEPASAPKPASPPPTEPAAMPLPAPKPATAAKPQAPTPPPKKAASAGFVVQVAAFSTRERALKVAQQLGGQVSKPAKYWLVLLGPYADSGEAAPALEKAKGAGYSDAQIRRAD